MTVSSTTARQTYIGDGSLATYSYNFRIFDDADLVLVKRNTTTGDETPLALTADYTVTGAGSYNGGTFTLAAGNLPTGYTLAAFRELDLLQPTDLRNQGAYLAEVQERALDRFVMICQQLQDQVNRSIRLPDSEAGGDAFKLPAKEVRALMGPYFDIDGNLVVGAPASAPVSVAMQPVVAAETLIAARAAFGTPWNDATQSIAIYVSSTGSDANDGLTVGAPLATLQAAFDLITNQRLGITGRYVINLAAGTYTNGALLSMAKPRDYRIVVQGPTVALNATPTAIINGAAATTDDGIFISGCYGVELRHILISGFAADSLTSSGVEIVSSQDVRLYNVHASGCGIGYYVRNGSSYTVTGGKITGCVHGVLELFNVVRNWKTVTALTDGLQITGGTYGLFAKEGCTGHMDYCTISDNTYGVFFSRQCSGNMTSAQVYRNGYAVVLRCSSQVVPLSVDWGLNTANKNTIPWLLDHSSNFVLAEQTVGATSGFMAQGERILGAVCPDPAISHTGTVTATVLYTWPTLMVMGCLHYRGTYVRIRVTGTKSGTAGTATLDMRFGNSSAISVTIPATATVWTFDAYLISQGVDKQLATGQLLTNATDFHAQAARTYAVSAGNFSVAVRCTLGSAADTVTINSAICYTTDRLDQEA